MLNVAQPHDQTESIFVSRATCCAASASHFTTRNHASRGWSPSRPPCPITDWNCNSSAIRLGLIPMSVNRRTRPRIPCRIVRFACTGDSRASPRAFGEVKYTCRTRSAALAAARHQSAASPPVYGGFAIVIAGRAPSFFSSWRSVSVLPRYRAFPSDHGAGVCAPNSSLSAITGVEHPVTETAKS